MLGAIFLAVRALVTNTELEARRITLGLPAFCTRVKRPFGFLGGTFLDCFVEGAPPFAAAKTLANGELVRAASLESDDLFFVHRLQQDEAGKRSEERRVGKEC